jgi:hypothetical protein
MARLEKKEPTAKLSESLKAELAEIHSLYEARVAERKVFLEGEIRKANPVEQGDLRRQLAGEIARLEEEREDKKERARRDAKA